MPEIVYNWKGAEAYTKGRKLSLQGIVLHSSDGHKQGDIDTLTGPTVSSHWYVAKDGSYWHFVDDSDTAFHAGKVFDSNWGNAGTIGIEQEHIDGEEPWTGPQVQAVANLVAALRQHHNLPLPCKSHADVARPVGRKVDPLGFPWNTFNDLAMAAGRQKWTFRQTHQTG